MVYSMCVQLSSELLVAGFLAPLWWSEILGVIFLSSSLAWLVLPIAAMAICIESERIASRPVAPRLPDNLAQHKALQLYFGKTVCLLTCCNRLSWGK